MGKLRILIVDDHQLVRCGAREVLHSRRGWRVVGEAAGGREGIEKAIALKPDIAVVDITLPDLDGLEVVRRIREAVPATKVIVLTMHQSDYLIQRAFDVGAQTYVLKGDLSKTLVKAVRFVSAGTGLLTPDVAKITQAGVGTISQHKKPSASTTPRETEIVAFLTEGKSNKEIAALLHISSRTVESHRAKIMLKFGFHSLADLIRYAIGR